MLAGPLATTSYADQTAANGTTYYYKVSATNAVGEGTALERGECHAGRTTERSRRPASTCRQQPATPRSRSPGALPPRTAARRSPRTRSTAAPAQGARACSRARSQRRATRTQSAANGTTYYYKVSATNAVGESDRSRTRRVPRRSHPPSAPGAPPQTCRQQPATPRSRSPGALPPRTAARRSPVHGLPRHQPRERELAREPARNDELRGPERRQRHDLLLQGVRHERGRAKDRSRTRRVPRRPTSSHPSSRSQCSTRSIARTRTRCRSVGAGATGFSGRPNGASG